MHLQGGTCVSPRPVGARWHHLAKYHLGGTCVSAGRHLHITEVVFTEVSPMYHRGITLASPMHYQCCCIWYTYQTRGTKPFTCHLRLCMAMRRTHISRFSLASALWQPASRCLLQPWRAGAHQSTQPHGSQHGSRTLVLLWSSLVVAVVVVVVSLVVVTSVVVVVTQWSCHWASSYQWWFGGESLSWSSYNWCTLCNSRCGPPTTTTTPRSG